MMADDELDGAILKGTHPQWRKVALIIGNTRGSSQETSERIAARIVALVTAGKLDSQGDLTKWRSSEIRLPPI